MFPFARAHRALNGGQGAPFKFTFKCEIPRLPEEDDDVYELHVQGIEHEIVNQAVFNVRKIPWLGLEYERAISYYKKSLEIYLDDRPAC